MVEGIDFSSLYLRRLRVLASESRKKKRGAQGGYSLLQVPVLEGKGVLVKSFFEFLNRLREGEALAECGFRAPAARSPGKKERTGKAGYREDKHWPRDEEIRPLQKKKRGISGPCSKEGCRHSDRPWGRGEIFTAGVSTTQLRR